mmetsp:Transcript_6823/g.17157  ORF Transcript_6823/g.17157 Transcript_6823/m.17157 type:complete len:203 (-) Transcript_6823:1226-1834(-)
MQFTKLVWPFSTAVDLLGSRKSHTRTVLSSEPDTRVHALTSNQMMELRCSSREAQHCCVVRSHILMVQSSDPENRRWSAVMCGLVSTATLFVLLPMQNGSGGHMRSANTARWWLRSTARGWSMPGFHILILKSLELVTSVLGQAWSGHSADADVCVGRLSMQFTARSCAWNECCSAPERKSHCRMRPSTAPAATMSSSKHSE